MTLSETAEQVLLENQSLFDIYHKDVIKTLKPSQDYIDGTLYYTFLMQKTVQKKIGRGKDAVTRLVPAFETIAVTSDREFFPFTEEALSDRGFQFPPTFTQASTMRWNNYAIDDWLRSKDTPIDGRAVFERLQSIYRDHVQYEDDIHYTTVPLYVMGSYLFQMYDSIGYIHFNGTQSSGKSQNLRLMEAFGFNTRWTSNMSEAALFRLTAGSPGVLCIDEAETFKSERGQELRMLLNAGYLKGSSANRTEKVGDGVFQVVEFRTYSPKVIASIAPLEPVLASRCLIINMQPAGRRIASFVETDPRWAEVRSNLYFWALQNASQVHDTIDQWNDTLRHELAKNLTDRTWQISQIYVTIGDYVLGREAILPVIEWFDNYFDKRRASNDEEDRQRKLLRVLPRVYALKGSPRAGHLSLSDITDVYKDHSEADEAEYIKSATIRKSLVALGWESRTRTSKGMAYAISEEEIRAQMKRREIVPYDEDLGWFKDGTNYGTAAPETASLWGQTPEPDTDDGSSTLFSNLEDLASDYPETDEAPF